MIPKSWAHSRVQIALAIAVSMFMMLVELQVASGIGLGTVTSSFYSLLQVSGNKREVSALEYFVYGAGKVEGTYSHSTLGCMSWAGQNATAKAIVLNGEPWDPRFPCWKGYRVNELSVLEDPNWQNYYWVDHAKKGGSNDWWPYYPEIDMNPLTEDMSPETCPGASWGLTIGDVTKSNPACAGSYSTLFHFDVLLGSWSLWNSDELMNPSIPVPAHSWTEFASLDEYFDYYVWHPAVTAWDGHYHNTFDSSFVDTTWDMITTEGEFVDYQCPEGVVPNSDGEYWGVVDRGCSFWQSLGSNCNATDEAFTFLGNGAESILFEDICLDVYAWLGISDEGLEERQVEWDALVYTIKDSYGWSEADSRWWAANECDAYIASLEWGYVECDKTVFDAVGPGVWVDDAFRFPNFGSPNLNLKVSYWEDVYPAANHTTDGKSQIWAETDAPCLGSGGWPLGVVRETEEPEPSGCRDFEVSLAVAFLRFVSGADTALSGTEAQRNPVLARDPGPVFNFTSWPSVDIKDFQGPVAECDIVFYGRAFEVDTLDCRLTEGIDCDARPSNVAKGRPYTANGGFLMQSILQHELGHCMGLHHSTDFLSSGNELCPQRGFPDGWGTSMLEGSYSAEKHRMRRNARPYTRDVATASFLFGP